jgi:hypothetical protein
MKIWKLLANGREVEQYSSEQKAKEELEKKFKEIQVNSWHKPPEEKSNYHFKFVYGWSETVCEWKIIECDVV